MEASDSLDLDSGSNNSAIVVREGLGECSVGSVRRGTSGRGAG